MALELTLDEAIFLSGAVQAAEQLKAPIPPGLKLKLLDELITVIHQTNERCACRQESIITDAPAEQPSA